MASKRHQRRRGCEGKVAHATQGEAWQAACLLRKSQSGGTWAAYKCPFCGRFHVGRPTARQRQAIRACREALAE
jgi:hypothetical protein